jgi:hypothetical protein
MLASAEFALDPTDPRFKRTPGVRALVQKLKQGKQQACGRADEAQAQQQAEQQRQRQQQQPGGGGGGGGSGGGAELNAMVRWWPC